MIKTTSFTTRTAYGTSLRKADHREQNEAGIERSVGVEVKETTDAPVRKRTI